MPTKNQALKNPNQANLAFAVSGASGTLHVGTEYRMSEGDVADFLFTVSPNDVNHGILTLAYHYAPKLANGSGRPLIAPILCEDIVPQYYNNIKTRRMIRMSCYLYQNNWLPIIFTTSPIALRGIGQVLSHHDFSESALRIKVKRTGSELSTSYVILSQREVDYEDLKSLPDMHLNTEGLALTTEAIQNLIKEHKGWDTLK